jgi:hypothetical protein
VYRPVFTHPPQSWQEWWSAVRRFAASWYGVDAGDVMGYHRDVDRLGQQADVSMSLPPGIHEWVAFAAHLRQAGAFGRALRDRLTLGWNPDIDAVTLLTLSEGDVCWGVHHKHLASEDPPVDTWLLDPRSKRPPRWLARHTPTTSQFALQHLIAYLHATGGGFNVTVPPSPGLIERLRNTGQTSIDLDGQLLVEDDDLIILAGTSLWTPDEDTGTTVTAQIGPSRVSSIPEILVDLARNPGIAHGAFIRPPRR